MLKCQDCGDVCITDTLELYQHCVDCGGKLVEINSEKKEERELEE